VWHSRHGPLTRDDAQKDRGEYRQAAGAATLKPCFEAGEDHGRNAKETDAIQVEQTHTAGWGAGRNDRKRFRTDAAAY
jgi:hypothetical protein